MTADEVRYRLMQRLSREPAATQRELAEEMGVSVGKINYCLRALIEKGHIKLDNFRRNPDKKHYTYLLTPAGIEAKGAPRAPERAPRAKGPAKEGTLSRISGFR